MTRNAVKVSPRNKSNPGCMTVETRDGSDDSLEKISRFFPSLANGGYAKVLREEGGRDLLDVNILHGGETGNNRHVWDALVWAEGDRYKAVDVVVERGHLRYDFNKDDGKWGVRVRVTLRNGERSEFVYPTSFRGYMKVDARAYIARALTAALNA